MEGGVEPSLQPLTGETFDYATEEKRCGNGLITPLVFQPLEV